MPIFYTPNIDQIKELPSDEAKHCSRVLRLTEGDHITLTEIGRAHV